MIGIYTGVLTAILAATGLQAVESDADYLKALAGHYPWEGATQGDLSFFELPTVARTLKRILPPSALLQITTELTTGTPNRMVDGYLLVSACKPHDCPSKNYIAVTNLRNAFVTVVLYDASLGADDRSRTQCFSEGGDLRMFPDSVIGEILESFLARTSKTQRLYETNQWIDTLRCRDGSNKSLERTHDR